MEQRQSTEDSVNSQSQQLVRKLTLEERIALLSGGDFWHTLDLKEKGLPSIMLTDGPHGLRKQNETADHLGIANSVPATCFPTAAATACSYDPELLSEMGEALGEECQVNDVSVILGPGVNIKRNPLCGRNFEYFSEDPYLAGCLGSGIVKGLKKKNVGASIKHFLANNQEKGRMVSNSVVDERALREIYLPAFEWIVKDADPATIMCAYNKVNGTFCCENKYFMTDILRDEWGFRGLVLSDWGAMNDRVSALRAGCDLEMPSSNGCNGRKLLEAVHSGQIKEEEITRSAERVAAMILRTTKEEKDSLEDTATENAENIKNYENIESTENIENTEINADNVENVVKEEKVGKDNANRSGRHQYTQSNHQLARKIARESAVLLKNDNMLPLRPENKILVIGEFAYRPRYQGAGSSQIHPIRNNCLCDELKRKHVVFDYEKGYDASTGETTDILISQAVEKAKTAKYVVIMAGLPSPYESEGFDRKDLSLPPAHNLLIQKVAEVNSKVCVVLSTGGAVLLPWKNQVSAILNMYLAGQNSGGAIYDLLFGTCSPCGKLAETYPEHLQDVPSLRWFNTEGKTVPYCESIYVGYRYYDTVEMKVVYPFGYGLTYTTFSYDSVKMSSNEITYTEKEAALLTCETEHVLEAEITITNTGNMVAKEIVELYVHAPEQKEFHPVHELRGFSKIELEPGQTGTVRIPLSGRAFAYYNSKWNKWQIAKGEYDIEIGASSRDIRLREKVQVAIDDSERDMDKIVNFRSRQLEQKKEKKSRFPGYNLKPGMQLHVHRVDFEQLLGTQIPSDPPVRPFTVNSTLGDIKVHWFGRMLNRKMYEQAEAAYATQDKKSSQTFCLMLDAMFADLPLRALGLMSGGVLSPDQVDGIVLVLNGHFFKGLQKLNQKK